MLPILRNAENVPFVGNFFDLFEDEFNRFFGPSIFKNDQGDYTYEMEVPGFNKENLKVEIANGILTISGEREAGHVGKTKIFKQLSIGSTPEDVNAQIKDGILTLTFRNHQKEVKQIEVQG
jgi:HSP20 family molecular chaperone IbpA